MSGGFIINAGYMWEARAADIAQAYSATPVRSNLKPAGKTWFVGAGGPMGRMHVQRAIEFSNPPATIVCTDVSDMRLGELCDAFAADAKAKGNRIHLSQPNEQKRLRSKHVCF